VDAAKAKRMIRSYRTFSEIEEVARRLRKNLDVDDLECPDLISMLENGLIHIYTGLRLVRVLDENLPSSEAVTDCYNRTITVQESVFQACLRGEPRARMTIAHELGHIALGHSGTRHRQNISLGTHDEKREESDAWHFARVFLAPTFLAVGCQSADQISEKFGLSADAADIRFAQLAELAKRGVEPSQRWKSRDRRSEDVRDSRGRRVLPKSVIDLLTEAQRRGRRITGLDRLDD
jgi:Zn-dependent peptidase ImmA (M78 family)